MTLRFVVELYSSFDINKWNFFGNLLERYLLAYISQTYENR